jgi:hypothetical protein
MDMAHLHILDTVLIRCSGVVSMLRALSSAVRFEIIALRSRGLGPIGNSAPVFDHQASATLSFSSHCRFPPDARKTGFFFGSFHRRAMRAWSRFLVSIKRGTPMPSLPSSPLAG